MCNALNRTGLIFSALVSDVTVKQLDLRLHLIFIQILVYLRAIQKQKNIKASGLRVQRECAESKRMVKCASFVLYTI